MLQYNNKKYVCHLDLAMDLIRGKWKAVIICHLYRGPKRFLKLQRIISGVSQKVLNEKLTELEKDDIIFKTTYPEVPPRVEYELTEKGKDLYTSLNLLEQWSKKYFSDL
ncbi:helix-turn-helix domain-containing protein [Clostridium oceanicum]|uniref:Helix-turn-helix domain-containing protein n=1 Tax=Clostridium oceanicum TaxID=1543 RepID=A0ABN1JAR9_9CLOT